jgi:metallo-beta-lactamase family protein
MAQITFFGATRGVTGSAYLLETDSTKILLECGLIQGTREESSRNRDAFPFDPTTLDAVVLSHAHLDHSGRLPKLIADGYTGPIYTTRPTCELLDVMLTDAAFLEKQDTKRINRRKKRAGKPEIEPLFDLRDVEGVLEQCEGIDYEKVASITDGIDLRFRDAGHILGSAIVELQISERGQSRTLVFSGDLGNSFAALLREPEIVEEADVLLLESTYGNRQHRSMDETLAEFEQIIADASANGGNILIPAFSVGRTQEIIFRLGELYQQGKLPHQAVYLDSPMAIATTEIYHRFQDIFNREDRALLRHGHSGSLHKLLPVLRYSSSTEESMSLNRITKGAIIIAGSGMMNGGRIRHHLKHNLWRKSAHLIIVGFQAMGTPGRALVDGAETFRMGGEEIAVNAHIHTLGGFSAHADQNQLVNWVKSFTKKRPQVYLIHGDPEAKAALRDRLAEETIAATIPEHGESFPL